MNNLPYTSTGKQILDCTGKHVADCASVEIAEFVTIISNNLKKFLETTKKAIDLISSCPDNEDFDGQGAIDILSQTIIQLERTI